MREEGFVLGVDVGTGSARAAVFDLKGRRAGHASAPIALHQPRPELAEQSSEDIWRAVGQAVRQTLSLAGMRADQVLGLGFDATASLAALDAADRPVSISPTGEDRWNVILWMDHRAVEEASRIDATAHEVLRYVGGRISPEMEPPKLLWVKKHLPASWRRAARFLDLTDFLTYRATGADVRSTCTAVCKWTYLAHEGRWPRDFFEQVGLEDLLGSSAAGEGSRAGREVKPPGTFLGGLRPEAARELGLAAGTAVGVGIIDAHAGALGLLGMALRGEAGPDGGTDGESLQSVLALIGGTSSCHLAVSPEPRFIPGVWGPYHSALLPGMWLTEGGQSAAGALLDHLLDDAAAAEEARRLASERGETVYEVLNREVERLREAEGEEPTAGLHVLPDFHGNRSPLADPTLRGVMSGLSLDRSLSGLARRYLAGLQALAHGTRHIIEVMNAAGYRIRSLLAAGGGTKNPLWLKEHADATGCRLVLPREPEAVLLGAAILGAVAARAYPTLPEAMTAMCGAETTVEPDPRRRAFHERKYRVFHRMHDHFLELRRIMEGTPEPGRDAPAKRSS